ncbi:MAG: ABC transporter ATP-binding protein [Planctomycetaceae bacterium]|nr:ABC transporter ATP-binding protein [Planctomycetaceae bacterium]
MINVEDFHKAYGETLAVAGLSFSLAAGDIMGLIGPNGAGKTTTLRALSGIITPGRGRISIAGHDIESDTLAAKRELAYIPDDPQLFPDLTVEEHLAFAASAYGVSDANQLADHLLQQFDLAGKRRALARDLSRGMRQKLAICCAYIHDPKAIFFDEPLTGLDPLGIRNLKKSMLTHAGNGAVVVVSSHLLAMVEDICTHVLILKQGEQRFFGPIEGLREQFGIANSDTTLENIFFLATDHPSAAFTLAPSR